MEDDVVARVADLLALEERMQEALDRVPQVAREHGDVNAALSRFRKQAASHADALRTRLPGGSGHPRPESSGSESISATLARLHLLISEAAYGYAVLHAVAHRYFDSQAEGNTADLAEGHLRDYAGAVEAITHLASEAAIWDLSRGARDCRCQCPSCGLGVCLCSPHGANTVGDIRRDAAALGAQQPAGGIRVRPPRQASAVQRAGIGPEDVVVAVDDREIPGETWDGIKLLQSTIKGHAHGDTIRLRVRRASGSIEDVSVIRP